MNIGPTIANRIVADGTVSDIMGTRIYPDYGRQADKVFPMAVYKVDGIEKPVTSDGATGFASAEFHVACVAPTAIAAAALADAIEAAIDSKAWTDDTTGLRVQGSFLKPDGREDDVVTNPQTEAILYYVVELTFDVRLSTL